MFALIWSYAALDDLADFYVAADLQERARMAAGVEALNARLRSDPLAEGESRDGTFRVTFISPLVVGFHVHTQGQLVRVVSVRRYGKQ
ncbi:MAG TPA: hypothetical protein VKD90_27490 [Gemmataceae bacterium]|nr:hypothetical protein [Gemmataceae bacterium]